MKMFHLTGEDDHKDEKHHHEDERPRSLEEVERDFGEEIAPDGDFTDPNAYIETHMGGVGADGGASEVAWQMAKEQNRGMTR
ncbi:hypothetical protein BK816_00260 [Boudabousia tangfeifanii]|uniref:Uncharacterized protein n=1 Tax=Boudabousia tangfeifanii TaxID=1912795 RepID=A0A1D9MHY2_9ACTO|nr:hypothetical protein [Boudabousia tangfeifanii]AOZ71915.1 hypothetical protein BK816_00260 [Boudabousia tangfeifanii]